MPFVRQPDLFEAAGAPAAQPAPSQEPRPPVAPEGLEDAALIAAIPHAGLADCHLLAAEAGRRHLVRAIPALGALCRRFKGFGLHHPVPEQVAVLTALAAIGGREAASAVAHIITDDVVQGPGLARAIRPS